jgi:hypothetical protein
LLRKPLFGLQNRRIQPKRLCETPSQIIPNNTPHPCGARKTIDNILGTVYYKIMNDLWIKYCLLIVFLFFSCSNKNNAGLTGEENNKNMTQDPIVIEDNNGRKTIDINKIFNSVVWNLDQNKVDELSKKFDENKLTDEDKEYIKDIYNDFIKFGGILYPEAAIILQHYIYGNGNDIIIKSDYFFQTEAVKNAMEENRSKKIIGPITIKTNDDPRLGYAVNGFYIKNEENDIQIYQYIEFGGRNNKEAYTPLKITMKNNIINLPHRLIRIFEEAGGCKSFTVTIIKENDMAK